MKILITGGAGYLGTIIIESLLKEGHDVTVLDNLLYKQTSLLPFTYSKKLKIIIDDVRNESLLKKLVESSDIIIPLAAIVGMPACNANPQMTIDVNYKQIANIVKWIGKNQMILVPNTNSQYGHLLK